MTEEIMTDPELIAAFDNFMDLDREWFEQHANEKSYHRKAVRHEFKGLLPPEYEWWVEVIEVAPGVRMRKPYGKPVAPIPGSSHSLVWKRAGM